MDNKKLIQGFIDKIDKKEHRFLFYIVDSKGHPMASITNIYDQANELIKLGYNACILTESEDYKGATWTGDKYNHIPVINVKQEELNISGSDFLIVPEIFSNVMESVKAFPCAKIVMFQNYEYSLETLDIAKKWVDYNFLDVIVTNDNMVDFVTRHYSPAKTHVVPLSIDENFKQKDLLREPVVLLGARDTGEATRFVKSFYLQNPHYQWITFKVIDEMTLETLSNEMSTASCLVWMDKSSSFGTLPLEALASGTPVIGYVPQMVPEWGLMNDNGESDPNTLIDSVIWVDNMFSAVDMLSKYLEIWLMGEVDNVLDMDKVDKILSKYTEEKRLVKIKEVYENLIDERKDFLNKILKRYE